MKKISELINQNFVNENKLYTACTFPRCISIEIYENDTMISSLICPLCKMPMMAGYGEYGLEDIKEELKKKNS